MPEDKLLSIPQVAEQCNVVENTVLNWIHDGKLKAYRLGPKTYRVRPDDLKKFLADRLVAA